jgi:hypothetical protein
MTREPLQAYTPEYLGLGNHAFSGIFSMGFAFNHDFLLGFAPMIRFAFNRGFFLVSL